MSSSPAHRTPSVPVLSGRCYTRHFLSLSLSLSLSLASCHSRFPSFLSPGLWWGAASPPRVCAPACCACQWFIRTCIQRLNDRTYIGQVRQSGSQQPHIRRSRLSYVYLCLVMAGVFPQRHGDILIGATRKVTKANTSHCSGQ